MEKILPWFTSKNGRLFTRSCVGMAVISIFGIKVAIHGPLLEKYSNIFQLHVHGKPKPLSPKVQQLIDEVFKENNFDEKVKEKIKFYNIIGHEFAHAGGINSPWGATIGLPFTIEDSKDVNYAKLHLYRKEYMEWVLDGQELLDSLNLSINAKKFAILREIYSCNISEPIENALLCVIAIIFPAQIIKNFNDKRDAFKRFSLKKRLLVYSLCYVMAYFLYICLKSPFAHLTEMESDKKAAQSGPKYLDGGIEFYEQTLKKNQCLRELLGSSGKKAYAKNGDENYILLAPKLPLSKRLELLKKQAKIKN